MYYSSLFIYFCWIFSRTYVSIDVLDLQERISVQCLVFKVLLFAQNAAQQSVHLTLGILRKSQAVSPAF